MEEDMTVHNWEGGKGRIKWEWNTVIGFFDRKKSI